MRESNSAVDRYIKKLEEYIDYLTGQGKKDAVIGAFSKQYTSLLSQMSHEINSFHYAVMINDSRCTSFPNSFSISKRFASSVSNTASFRFFLTSSNVAPCVFAPGTSSIHPI